MMKRRRARNLGALCRRMAAACPTLGSTLGSMSSRILGPMLVVPGLLSLPVPAGAAPAAGHYAAELCVAVGTAAATCGPVQVQVHNAQRLTVRVADIAYRLELHSSQVDVVTMHGAMQIDGFAAPYEWAGTGTDPALQLLQFDDLPKRTRYTLRLTPGRRAPG